MLANGCKYIVVIIAAMMMLTGSVSSQTGTQRYIVLARQPLAWQWHAERPYDELRDMCWTNASGFCDEFVERPQLLYRVVDTETSTITEIYTVGDSAFAWTFAERRGADGHPHPVRAVWVEYTDCEMVDC